MLKETKILKPHIETHKYCDDCGIEIKKGMACNKAQCEYCNKDLCEHCIGHEEDCGGDYRTVFCKRCWDIGNDYRPKIEKLEKEESDLYNEWVAKCKDIN